MITTLRIAYVDEAPGPFPSEDDLGPKYLRFISELEQHLGIRAERFRKVEEALGFDFILLSGADVGNVLRRLADDIGDRFKQRVIPLNASRSKIFERLLEPYKIPAAVDTLSLIEDWMLVTESGLTARALYGLRDIGILIGASCFVFPQSEHYCNLQSKTHQGLPHLLASYLSMLHSRGYCRSSE